MMKAATAIASRAALFKVAPDKRPDFQFVRSIVRRTDEKPNYVTISTGFGGRGARSFVSSRNDMSRQKRRHRFDYPQV
jgi:hypothetical protein